MLKSSYPEASIIVAVYNRPEQIKKCIESLLNLHSSSPSHEIIVIDNGSTDETKEAVQQFPKVRFFVRDDKRGAGPARNLGIKYSKGSMIAITDSDCEVDQHWLTHGLNALLNPEAGIVGGKILPNLPTSNLIQEWMNEKDVLDQNWTLNHSILQGVQTANAFFRKSDILDVGLFNENLRYGEDIELCQKVLEHTGKKIVYEPKSIVFHDHRSTYREVWDQFYNNCGSVVYLAKIFDDYPKKSWKTSVWELWDIFRAGLHYLGTCLQFKPKKERTFSKLELIAKSARKWGMIVGAIKTRQWSRW